MFPVRWQIDFNLKNTNSDVNSIKFNKKYLIFSFIHLGASTAAEVLSSWLFTAGLPMAL